MFEAKRLAACCWHSRLQEQTFNLILQHGLISGDFGAGHLSGLFPFDAQKHEQMSPMSRSWQRSGVAQILRPRDRLGIFSHACMAQTRGALCKSRQSILWAMSLSRRTRGLLICKLSKMILIRCSVSENLVLTFFAQNAR